MKIINYLDSAKPQHLRWRPKSGVPYCNIYAYDLCYLAGVYLPRVRWRPGAIDAIPGSEAVEPKYGNTVSELNGNALYDWFDDYSPSYGWARETNPSALQAATNQGHVGIIVAKRTNTNASGHIAAMVPEHGNFKAQRNASDQVQRPLQCQAGRKNYKFSSGSSAWWTGSQFADFSLWRQA